MVEVADVLTLAGELGVSCVRADEAFPSWYAVPNPGFENDLEGWEAVLTGAATAVAVIDAPATGLPGTHSAKLTTTALTDKAVLSAPCVAPPNQGFGRSRGALA